MAMAQPLLTPISVASSLAPPRVPPHGSVHRAWYTNPKAAKQAILSSAHHHHIRDGSSSNSDATNEDIDHGHYSYQLHAIPSRLHQLFAPHMSNALQPHPHLPSSLSLPDKLTRLLGVALPLEKQHSMRDNGTFRSIADNMVKITCPMLAMGHVKEVREFLELSRPSTSGFPEGRERRRRWTRRRVPYGDNSMQYLDLFLPANKNCNHTQNNKIPVRGTIFFIHGGAWGSGQPWMYRLVAPAFLKLGFAVVIVGYRTYPDSPTIDDQVGDAKLAWDMCEDVLNKLVVPTDCNVADSGWVGNVLIGHSSGAHVALLMLVDMVGDQMNNQSRRRDMPSPSMRHAYANRNNRCNNYPWTMDYFVGLSGPYDIAYHFDFEGGRGVEQISPMGAICGHTRENFDKASPVKRLLQLVGRQTESDGVRASPTFPTAPNVQQLVPPILLVHGIEDPVVPFTATADAGRLLRSCGLKRCDEFYVEETGHQDVIMHFMLGGPAKDLVIDWLLKRSIEERSEQLQSRL